MPKSGTMTDLSTPLVPTAVGIRCGRDDKKHMELIDILDEQGNPTGQVKPQPDVHRDGDWHKTVHLWILNSSGKL